jgi:exodeoxyribonuclease V beta subunit
MAFDKPSKEPRAGRKRALRRPIAAHWPMASFSSLTAATPDQVDEQADRDMSTRDALSDNGVPGEFETLFSFPKGAHAGLFFHDLLEHWDHTGGRSGEQEELIRSKLQAHGFAPQWLPTVERFLRQLSVKRLHVPGSTFSLSQVAMDQRINEMEFYFSLQRFSSEHLKECFNQYGDARVRNAVGARLGRISFAPQHGFMKGFMDAVVQYGHRYYLLDWKSNHLGHHPESYDPQVLEKCMVEDDYFLQYHLYTVALNRLLAQKVEGYRYERHFGGVLYIFLRGITADPAERSGLFFAKPDALLISALDDLMIPTG